MITTDNFTHVEAKTVIDPLTDDDLPTIEYDGGPIYDGHTYLENEEMYIDSIVCDLKKGEEITEDQYAHPCIVRKVSDVNAYHLTELITDRLMEDFETEDIYWNDVTDTFNDVKGLQESIQEWLKKQTHQVWDADTKKRICFKKELFKEG